MDFGLVFQQAIDRQDRTLQTEGRFSLLELHGDITTAWYTGILHRTRTRCKTTCLVGHHSIEATSCNRNDETISQPTSQETDFDSFASRTPLTPTPVNPSPKYWTPTLTPIDTTPYIGRKHLPCQMFQLNGPYLHDTFHDTHYDSCTTRYMSNDAKPLPGNQTGLPASMEVSPVLRIQFVFIVFAIYPKLLNIFYSTLLPIFHRNISPLLSNLSTMALTKTSIIKTRSQSRTGTKARTPVAVATGRRTTGTNVRTNDRTIDTHAAPTTGRTIDSVAPAPVVHTTDLFANRPKTGALKDPPVPRDRDSHRDSDDNAKKPAAKPKGQGPKATTRKPHKPRTDPADGLVDPMSRVHVTAGGIARAGGNDPVLANPEHRDPEQSAEPQPKKKTRRTTRASRAHRAGHGDDDDDEDS